MAAEQFEAKGHCRKEDERGDGQLEHCIVLCVAGRAKGGSLVGEIFQVKAIALGILCTVLPQRLRTEGEKKGRGLLVDKYTTQKDFFFFCIDTRKAVSGGRFRYCNVARRG